MDSQLLEMRQHIARLEKDLRDTHRRLLIGVTMMVVVAFGVGRTTALQTQAGSKSTFQAPFEIVDGAGRPILRVEADAQFRGLKAMTSRGEAVVLVGAQEAGEVLVLGSASQGYAALSISDDLGAVSVGGSISRTPLGYLGSAKGSFKGLAVGKRAPDVSGIALRLLEDDGTAVAELSNGPGDDGGMSLKIRTRKDAIVAALGLSPFERTPNAAAYTTLKNGGGALRLADAGGKLVVLSGEDSQGSGTVRAYMAEKLGAGLNGAGNVAAFGKTGPEGTAIATLRVEGERGQIALRGNDKSSGIFLGATDGGGFFELNKGNSGVQIGIKEGGLADVCVQVKKQTCVSGLAIKALMPYF